MRQIHGRVTIHPADSARFQQNGAWACSVQRSRSLEVGLTGPIDLLRRGAEPVPIKSAVEPPSL
jgi:hypothetical protein